MFVNYNDCILNYIASIRDYYQLESSYPADSEFSKLINKHQFDQIILVLIDALGSRLLDKHLEADAFLNRYKLWETTTVFPTTTTAATTAILNGKSPNENAWLGWIQYIPELDNHIIPFLDSGYYDKSKYPIGTFKNKYPVKDIITELNEKGIKSRKIFPPFDCVDGCKDMDEFMDTIVKEAQTKENKFVYAYWDEYDSLMHKVGPSSPEAKNLLKKINDKLETVAQNLPPKTLMVVIADHGQVDVENENLLDTGLDKYFRLAPDIEPRALNFHIKEGMGEQFRQAFLELYEDECVLLTKEEVLKSNLFGDNSKNHPEFESMLGDFLALSKGHKHFVFDPNNTMNFKGSHAGINIDELMVPVIVYYND